MKNQLKQAISEEIAALVTRSSQVKVSNRADVSNVTISQMINGNWSKISNEMWRRVQVKLRIDPNWNTATTRNYQHLTNLLKFSQSQSLSIGISHDAGTGKSHAYKSYSRNNDNVIYVECKNIWSKKSYIKALLSAAGLSFEGTTEQMFEAFITHIRSLEKPLVIIDQIDKLKDSQMDLFMDMYNDLDGSCGFVISGVPALKKRVLRGVQRDKIGYRELWSRIGRKFIHLEPIKINDVASICEQNGIIDINDIEEIYANCDGDLRRVRRDIEKYSLIKKQAA